jgi:hypothetical protein
VVIRTQRLDLAKLEGGMSNLVRTFSVISWLLALAIVPGAATAQTHRFPPPATQLQRVKVTLQVQGKLKLLGTDNKERQIPLEVSGNFDYEEKVEASSSLWSSRFYRVAEADIKLDKATHQPRLGVTRREVGVKLDGPKTLFWSPGGPLSRDEAELIDLHANSVLLSDLLPEGDVRIGDTWKPTEETLSRFLTLDAVNSSDVACKLAEVAEGRAVVEMQGVVTGAVEGVATEIELSAKFGYHLTERRFTSLALVFKENRSIGKAEPGFEVSAKLTMVLTTVASSERLSEAAVAGIRKGLGVAPPLAFESTLQGFRVLIDPRWRVMIDRNEVTVFRLVKDGDAVAQCNLSSLPPLAEGRRLQLEEFQQDIQKSLGENFGQFIEASQGESDHGLRVLRVVAAGEASELPIHWIYYHVSNDAGRRLTYVFTMEAEKTRSFGGADAAFTASLELFDPTPAPQAEGGVVREARAPQGP